MFKRKQTINKVPPNIFTGFYVRKKVPLNVLKAKEQQER